MTSICGVGWGGGDVTMIPATGDAVNTEPQGLCSQGRTCSVTHDIAPHIWGTPEPQAENILICFFGLNVFSGRGRGPIGGPGGTPSYRTPALFRGSAERETPRVGPELPNGF